MKLVILVIYSKSKDYNKMLEIQRSYLHQFPNVTSYFIDLREQEKELEIENDFIYVKGKDTYINITYKTIKALSYIIDKSFDYVIRTNMSTIINIPSLFNYCSSLPKTNVYTGGKPLNLQWLDKKSGIIDKTFWGTNYIQGTGIIMSYDIVNNIVKHEKKIIYTVVDDVAIGIFIKKYVPSAYYFNFPSFFVVKNYTKPSEIDKKYVFFRNRYNDKIKDRTIDIKNMKMIRNVLFKHNKTLKYRKQKLKTKKSRLV